VSGSFGDVSQFRVMQFATEHRKVTSGGFVETSLEDVLVLIDKDGRFAVCQSAGHKDQKKQSVVGHCRLMGEGVQSSGNGSEGAVISLDQSRFVYRHFGSIVGTGQQLGIRYWIIGK